MEECFFFFFSLFFPFSPSSLREVTLNRELFSRLQPEFYNKISVRSPYFFHMQSCGCNYMTAALLADMQQIELGISRAESVSCYSMS